MMFFPPVLTLSEFQKFPSSHARYAMRAITMTKRDEAMEAVREKRMMVAHRNASEIVWLMNRNKNTKWILQRV